MGLLTDYFASADDVGAASVAVGGPGMIDPATMRARLPAVDLPGIDPFVVLGTLASLLAGRPYAEVTRHPRHGSLVATAGDEGPWVVSVSDELVATLAVTSRATLEDVAVRWAATDELVGSDPEVLATALHRLAALCVRADDAGHRLYFWTSL
jgi:hypothetical protein